MTDAGGKRDRALGFIGLGLMGKPMALRLAAAGYTLHLWNRSPAKLEGLQGPHIHIHDSPASAAQSAEIVCLCVSDAAAVEDVVFGATGIGSVPAHGGILIDFSSIPPDRTRLMAARLQRQSGRTWIDAPVSGGVAGAERGTLAIMCGGAVDDLERVRPVLSCLAQRVTNMGDTGAGQLTKLCNQMIVACNVAAIAEAIAFARRSGIDVERVPDALTGGWADSQPLQIIGRRMAAGTWDTRIGAIATMLKDINTAVDAASNTGLATPVATAVAGVYRGIAARGLAQEDLSALSMLCDDSAPA